MSSDDGGRLQVLATEHWGLLSARSLTYNEALSRVTIFLAILSGAVISLALVAQADRFGPIFTAVAIPMLLVVLYTGIATIARLNTLNRDDYRWVIAMNRIRRAYLDRFPDLAPHFTTGATDDLAGALLTLGVDAPVPRLGVTSIFHLVQTLPGIISVLVASVAAAIGALIARAFGAGPDLMELTAALVFAAFLALMAISGRRSFSQPAPSLMPRFPSGGGGQAEDDEGTGGSPSSAD